MAKLSQQFSWLRKVLIISYRKYSIKLKISSGVERMVDRNVSSYYNGEDNFQDEMPYDLYNMVEMYKKISKASILPNFGEI